MIKKLILVTVLLLVIISSNPVISIGIKQDSFFNLNQTALTPSTNQVTFVYFNGGAPVYTKAQLDMFLNDILEPFLVREVSDIDTYDKLENATVLMLLGQTDLSSLEMNVLNQFLIEGGSLLIALPPDNFSAFNEILKLFALKPLGPVLDNSSYYENMTDIIVNDSYMINDHPVINSVFGNISRVLVPRGAGILIEKKKPLINATFESYSLIWGLNSTFIDENGNGELDENEIHGSNISLVRVIETWYGGRIVILSSIEMIIDNVLLRTEFDNLIFCKALVYWLGYQIGYISIRDISANPTFIDITKDKLEINVTFTITDENNATLKHIQVNACLVRLNEIIVSSAAIGSGPKYEAKLNVSGIKPGLVYLYVMAYKKYYGYFWAKGPKITLYKPPVTITSVDALILVFGALVPLVLVIALSVYVFPEYRDKKRKLREIEDKIKKK